MKFKILIVFIVLFFFAEAIMAQSSSSYSRYGIGDSYFSYSARRAGMGDLGVSLADNDFIGAVNPASWFAFNKTRIEFSGSYNGLSLSNNGNSSYTAETEFSGFTFGFPISTLYGVGLVLGAVPVSNVSYNVLQEFNPGSAEGYEINYEGRGGLSKIFIGSSYKLPGNISFGASLDYYFGNLNYRSSVDFDNTDNNPAEYFRRYSPKGIGGTAGLISPDLSFFLNTESISELRIGGAVSFSSDLSTDTILTSTASGVIDTLGQGIVSMHIPPKIMAGLSFKLHQKYLFTLDYASQAWEEFTFYEIKSHNLRNAYKLSGGIEIRPAQSTSQSFWEQIIYRAGLSFEQTQYMLNNVGIDQYSISGGISFPISNDNSIDIGIQYGMRGTNDSNLFKENIYRVNFGLSLGEIWFIRQDK